MQQIYKNSVKWLIFIYYSDWLLNCCHLFSVKTISKRKVTHYVSLVDFSQDQVCPLRLHRLLRHHLLQCKTEVALLRPFLRMLATTAWLYSAIYAISTNPLYVKPKSS